MPRWHVPWLTLPLKGAIRKKQRLYRKAKQLQTHEKKKQKSTKNKSWLVEKCWRHGSRCPTRDRRRYFLGGWDTQEPTRGVYSHRLAHLGKIITTSVLTYFKKIHMNFHQFFFFKNLSSVETYHPFKRTKLVKNLEYRIKYFKVHVLYDKQTIQNFVPFQKRFSYG